MLAKLHCGTGTGPPCLPDILSQYPLLKAWYCRVEDATGMKAGMPKESQRWTAEHRDVMLRDPDKWSIALEEWKKVPMVKRKLEKN